MRKGSDPVLLMSRIRFFCGPHWLRMRTFRIRVAAPDPGIVRFGKGGQHFYKCLYVYPVLSLGNGPENVCFFPNYLLFLN